MTTAHRAYLCCMAATMLILVPLLASTLARAEIPRSAPDLARDGTSKQNATMALIGVCWRSGELESTRPMRGNTDRFLLSFRKP